MSPELKYLALTALLTASLWIPYVVAQVVTNGPLKPANYVDPTPRPLPLWGQRANRLYINAVETFAPFAAIVILVQLAGKNDFHDRVLDNELFLATARARHRVSGGYSVHSYDHFRARLCLHHWALCRAHEVTSLWCALAHRAGTTPGSMDTPA